MKPCWALRLQEPPGFHAQHNAIKGLIKRNDGLVHVWGVPHRVGPGEIGGQGRLQAAYRRDSEITSC